ncbi:hypothetical protein [Cytobacillus firmus]|uniref:hypothetical protein n=1 Tax=Cytobacillus firmus TaxID=1399 RepID=UPI0018CF1C55|nr:hypothetical protein [Cytobacillus firmus]MBG9548331.1 hypothetical protein [Cytobacillus firmus]MBG9600819.1 hypothetical protein [Cytobacillus firmus]MED1938919.1 hypothetical protein [Cytobacillus firmus]
MSNSELLLKKFEKKFIDPEHPKKLIRGTTFDGEGNAFATDGFQALKISGFPVDGNVWIRGLNGKPIDEKPSLLNTLKMLFKRESLELVGTVDPKEILEGARLILSVQKEDLKSQEKKVRELNKVRLLGENGRMVIEYKGIEVIGSVTVGSSKDFSISVNNKRLIDCLSVFEKETDSVKVLVSQTLLRFESVGVAVVLLPIK